MKVFLDTNVFLDTLLPKREFKNESFEILGLHKLKDFRLHISSLSIANIVFCARKYVPKNELFEVVDNIRYNFKVLPLGAADIDSAIESGCPDFEDAMQIAMAEMESDVIVTGNKKHFAPYTDIPVFTPDEFLAKITE